MNLASGASAGDGDDQLVELTWLTATIQLPSPLRAGALVIDARQYCCVRAVLANGSVGESFVLTRGLDVGGAVRDLIAPRLLGESLGLDGAAEDRLRVGLRNAGWDGAISRAAAAVSLAALDARARARDVPAWKLLTPVASDLPRIVAAIGYTPVDGNPRETELTEAAAAADAGVSVVKLMGGFEAPDVDVERLRRVRDVVGGACGIALDVNGNWSRPQTLETWPRLADLGVAFVEEPWPIELGLHGDWPDRSSSSPAMAFGEVCSSVVELEAIAATGHVQHIRPDVSVLGGARRFLDLLPKLSNRGRELMPHFWPEVHRHLLMAYPGPAWVEATMPGVGGFGLERFVDGAAYAGEDLTHVPSQPGFGYALDWPVLRSLADAPAVTASVNDDPARL